MEAAEPQAAVGGSGRLGVPRSAAALGPLPCLNCGQRVMWVRADGFWRLRDEDGVKHRCKKAKAA